MESIVSSFSVLNRHMGIYDLVWYASPSADAAEASESSNDSVKWISEKYRSVRSLRPSRIMLRSDFSRYTHSPQIRKGCRKLQLLKSHTTSSEKSVASVLSMTLNIIFKAFPILGSLSNDGICMTVGILVNSQQMPILMVRLSIGVYVIAKYEMVKLQINFHI